MRMLTSLAFALTLLWLAPACSDDDSNVGSAGSGGSANGGSANGGSANGGSGGTGNAGIGGVAGGSGTGGTAGGVAGGSGGGVSCIAPDILSVLDDHLQDVIASGSLLATHPSANESTIFFLAPGLPEPPGFVATFASLFMPCSAPTLYDPYCEEDHCTRIECTGEGAGWVNHAYLDSPPYQSGGFSFDSATLDNAWADGASGTTFTIAATATGPGSTNWSMNGSGSFGLTDVQLEEAFPSLLAAGAATLAYDSAASPKGGVEVEGVMIAEVGPTGHLVATGNCPP